MKKLENYKEAVKAAKEQVNRLRKENNIPENYCCDIVFSREQQEILGKLLEEDEIKEFGSSSRFRVYPYKNKLYVVIDNIYDVSLDDLNSKNRSSTFSLSTKRTE